jgi:hypothetical protein
MLYPRTNLGFPRHLLIGFLVAFAALIGLSLAYDAMIERVSTTTATLSGVHAKCGPVTMSGPKEAQGFRSKRSYFLMARLSDGHLIRVERPAGPFPPCGATIEISERHTPWSTTWYSTRD